MTSRFFYHSNGMLRWNEGAKLTTNAACYLALEVTDNMVFVKTTAKFYQLFLPAAHFVRKKKNFQLD